MMKLDSEFSLFTPHLGLNCVFPSLMEDSKLVSTQSPEMLRILKILNNVECRYQQYHHTEV